MCNLCRGYLKEQFCEIILNLGHGLRRRCRLKKFLSGSLAALLCGGEEPFMQFRKKASWGAFIGSYMYMKFGPVVQEENSFKDISYLELWQPHCLVDWNHLCNFIGRHH